MLFFEVLLRKRLIFLFIYSRPLSSGCCESGGGTNGTAEHQQSVFARQPRGVRGKNRGENAGIAVGMFFCQFRFRSQRLGPQVGAATHRKHRHHYARPVSESPFPPLMFCGISERMVDFRPCSFCFRF